MKGLAKSLTKSLSENLAKQDTGLIKSPSTLIKNLTRSLLRVTTRILIMGSGFGIIPVRSLEGASTGGSIYV